MQPTVEVTGIVRLPEGVAPAAMTVALEAIDTSIPGGGARGRVDASGNWKVQGVAPGRYRFVVSPVPEGTWLKSVSVQGQDITDGAAISAAASGIEITLAGNAPQVTGTVTLEKEPADAATVVLVPDAARRDRAWLFRTTATDERGAFSVRNIPPGDYTVYALTGNVEEGIWYSPEFLKQMQGKGTDIRLDESAHESVQIELTK
jgi:hypothetical protein